MTEMMECGHAANATTGNGKPACAICDGPRSTTVASAPDLTGRRARCSYFGSTPSGRSHSGSDCKRGEPCKCEVPSATSLAFFGHKPKNQFDEFYCGCWGWD
jgi:hypothetical protein